MAPPPLPLFSPSPKQPPPPPWLHGPKFPAALNPIEAPPKPQKNDLPNPQTKNNSSSTNPLAAGIPGGPTRRAVLGIIRRVRSLELSNPPNTKPRPNSSNSTTIPSFNLFPVDRPQQGDRQEEEETGRNEKGRPASSSRALPWSAARDEDLKVVLRREKKVREPTAAERLLEPAELDRLRRAARGMNSWVRAKKAGVTDEVVEDVQKECSSGRELAAVRVIEPLRRCMDRAREILETKSGGLVVQENYLADGRRRRTAEEVGLAGSAGAGQSGDGRGAEARAESSAGRSSADAGEVPRGGEALGAGAKERQAHAGRQVPWLLSEPRCRRRRNQALQPPVAGATAPTGGQR